MTDKEIKDDFLRFIRHEAMRANCTQDDVFKAILTEKWNYE